MTTDLDLHTPGGFERHAAKWQQLTSASSSRESTSRRLPRLRSVVLQFALAAVAALILVGVAGAIVSRNTAENQSVHEVAQLTNVVADSVVQPALTNEMATDSAAAKRGLDRLVRKHVLSDSLVRVKIWTPRGRILYSDEGRLIGEQFGLDDSARDALSRPQTRAEISNLSQPENRFERGRGALLEVYRPVWTPDGHSLLFETYFRYDQVSDRATQLWRGFAGITLSSLAAVVLLLAPLVWTLLARARRAHAQREAMLQRSMDASVDERRRIAATLHDGVVQELVAASFAVAAGAQNAAAKGDQELAHRLGEAGEAVRTSIGGMRSLLVDIYPPNLQSAGLVPALRDLAATHGGREPAVVLELDERAATGLGAEQQQACFRVAQECLRNAAKHARAATLTISLRREEAYVVLEVTDDGVGFDSSAHRAQGHLGLSLMTDLAREVGGELALRAAPGAGTTVRLRLASS